jgi:hypothetical protein
VHDGLILVPPEEGWRATMIASDRVIGDHGSTTQYAAAIGRPVILATHPAYAIRTGSIADRLSNIAPLLDLDRELVPQLSDAAAVGGHIAGMVTSRPGRAASLLRRTMYDLLELPEPQEAAVVPPVPRPIPISLGT